jgi:hypothetical protein
LTSFAVSVPTMTESAKKAMMPMPYALISAICFNNKK